MPVVETPAGVTLHYEETGSGRPLLFLHGWAMSGRVWRFQQPLADPYRLIYLDQRGHGGSTAASSYTIDDFAGDLVAFLDVMDLRDAVVVGWSMGVQVVLHAVQAMNARVAGLILVGGTPRFTSAAGYPHGQPPVEVKGMGVRLRRDYQKTMGDFFKGMFSEGELDHPQYQRIVHEIVMAGKSPDPDAAKQALRILSDVDLREELAAIKLPVLLIHGDKDTICPASASAYMAKRLPHGSLELMHGCGHAPFMTRPDEFNAKVREFLEKL
jgi:pimeloyl-ACP methyl ester esterase